MKIRYFIIIFIIYGFNNISCKKEIKPNRLPEIDYTNNRLPFMAFYFNDWDAVIAYEGTSGWFLSSKDYFKIERDIFTPKQKEYTFISGGYANEVGIKIYIPTDIIENSKRFNKDIFATVYYNQKLYITDTVSSNSNGLLSLTYTNSKLNGHFDFVAKDSTGNEIKIHDGRFME